jgi:hypothetical protein
MEATKEVKENMISAPITFTQFVKNPVTGMLFICILAIGYLMWDTKQMSKRQEERILALELEVRQAYVEIQKLKEENGAMKSELLVRKELKNNK